jgi:hypothetical protein
MTDGRDQFIERNEPAPEAATLVCFFGPLAGDFFHAKTINADQRRLTV